MKKNVYLIILFVAACWAGDVFAQVKRYKLIQKDHKTEVVEDQDPASHLRTAAHEIGVTVSPDSIRPESAINIHISFGLSVNIDAIGNVVLAVKPACYTPLCNEPFITSTNLSSKIINKTTRTIDFTIGGLLPFKEYDLWGAVFGLDGDRCTGSDIALIYFKTAPTPAAKPEKMLIVIDKEYEGNAQLNAALARYQSDATVTRPMLQFEKYYVEGNNSQRQALYQHIRQKFNTDNLTNLFFLGDNAAITGQRVMLNNQGEPVATYASTTFSYYAHPMYTTYEYNAFDNTFRFYDRQDLCAIPPTEVRPEVYQQQNAMISMGMVIPDVTFNLNQQIDYLVTYFGKVHAFLARDISFDSKVLITDGFVSEAGVVQQAEANGLWTAEVLQFGRAKDPDYYGDDVVWKNDFMSRLGTKSYEIFSLNLHGTWNYHAFGIFNQDIADLPALNTRLIDLYSCSVGNFQGNNYMAGHYLGKGNVLNVHAFCENIGIFSEVGESGLKRLYAPNGVYQYFSRGFSIADSYRYAQSYSESEVILGDPLLKLRSDVPLPVRLVSFDAHAQEGNAALTWVTAEEVNSERFEIEHSENGRIWTNVGAVKTRGNGEGRQQYEFLHTTPVPGQNLYRLKTVDLDGSFAFSKVKSLTFGSDNLFSVYPNPVADKLSIAAFGTLAVKSVSVLNSAGQVVRYFGEVPGGTVRLNGLADGAYVVKVTTTDGKSVTRKVVKGK